MVEFLYCPSLAGFFFFQLKLLIILKNEMKRSNKTDNAPQAYILFLFYHLHFLRQCSCTYMSGGLSLPAALVLLLMNRKKIISVQVLWYVRGKQDPASFSLKLSHNDKL